MKIYPCKIRYFTDFFEESLVRSSSYHIQQTHHQFLCCLHNFIDRNLFFKLALSLSDPSFCREKAFKLVYQAIE